MNLGEMMSSMYSMYVALGIDEETASCMTAAMINSQIEGASCFE